MYFLAFGNLWAAASTLPALTALRSVWAWGAGIAAITLLCYLPGGVRDFLRLWVTLWGATLLARRLNARAGGAAFHAALGCGVLLAIGSALALLAGPRAFAMDPSSHVYPATVWLLSGWAVVHVVAGVVMQLYCLARRARGRMTPEHDIDIRNVALYWHFAVITVVVTVAVLAGFPLAR